MLIESLADNHYSIRLSPIFPRKIELVPMLSIFDKNQWLSPVFSIIQAEMANPKETRKLTTRGNKLSCIRKFNISTLPLNQIHFI